MRSSQRVLLHLSLLCLVPFSFGFASPFHEGDNSPKSIENSAPPGLGGNGPYQREGMELLGHLQISEMGGGPANVVGSDCWGWTDPQTGKEYAIACLTNATSFVDISDPTDPKYLGKVNTQTGNATWRDVKVYENHAFIVSDGNGAHGMQVFDMTQLRTADPNSPQTFPATALYSNITNCHNIVINEDTGYAYCVGSSQASGGLHVVDISSPANPTFAGNYSAAGYTHDAQVVIYNGPDSEHVGKEIAFNCNGSLSGEDTLAIVDVSNKSNMNSISIVSYPNDGYTHQCWLTEDQRYLYLCDETDESDQGGPTKTIVYDMLDLDSPVFLGVYNGTSNAIDHNIYIKDDLAYLASYSAGVRILQIDPSDPVGLDEIAYFDTFPTNTGTNFDGCWSVYPYFESGVIFANDRSNGLFLVRMTGLTFSYPSERPELVDPDGGTTMDVAVNALIGSVASDSGILHVDRGNGYEQFPMTETSPGNFTATFPSSPCGQTVNYYVSAETADGQIVTDPSMAPTNVYNVMSADGFEVTFEDDFQTSNGWTVSGDAADGQWERGVPAGDADRGDPGADGDGSGACYLTDNVAGNSDVDDGSTILVSPTMDAVGTGNGIGSMISYYRWYSNDIGGDPANDIFVVDISNDNGATWVNLETVGPTGSEISGGWFYKSFTIDDFLTPTNQMRLRFTASDLNGGSVIEAAVDGIRISSVMCNSDPEVVVPATMTVTRGTQQAGGVSELGTSDNADLSVSRATSDVAAVTEFEVEAVSPSADPTSFEISLEGSVFARTSVNQTIELYNFETSSWEILDTQEATRFVDSTFDVGATGDLSRFVEAGTNAIRARVRFQSVNPRQRFTSNTDMFTWTIQ